MARRLAPLGLASLVTTAVVTSSLGCDKRAGQGGAADAAAPGTSLLTPEQSARVLARVGERTITLGEFAAALEHMDQFDRLRYQSPERRKELLNEMVNVELLAQEAVARGYDKDPLAEQEVREILRDAMLAEARKGAPAPADLPEADVRAFYEAHRAEFRDPERRRISVVVVSGESAARDVLEAARKAPTAAAWGELVRARSIDANAKANVPVDLAGDIGFVSAPDSGANDNPRVPTEVRAAAFEIAQPNEVLPRVVRAGDKVYVVRLTARTEAHESSFAEAERRIRVRMAQERTRAREREVLDQLRREFPVQVDEAALSRVKVEAWPALDAGHAPR